MSIRVRWGALLAALLVVFWITMNATMLLAWLGAAPIDWVRPVGRIIGAAAAIAFLWLLFRGVSQPNKERSANPA